MEDTPIASETANRRPKRTRAQTTTAAAADRTTKASGRDNPDETSDRSDQSPNQAELDDSFDDFEGPRSRSKRKRASEGASAAAPTESHSLIEVIKGNGKLIPQVVKLWVEQYEKDSKPAMVELLMMLFEACGAKYHIREEFLDETDVDDVVVALVNLAKKGEVEDYQSSKKKEFKNFKDNLTSFWDNLVIECQNGPLFDQVLFDKCMDYVIALSCTPPRIFRQVASLVGLQLVTSLINVAKMLGAQRETTQRQLNAEQKKHIDGPRVESLNKRLSMTHEKITVIDTMMRKIFTGLFVHRYRDIDPDIRMSCIQSLGVWILSYPSLFLQDLYLKYLGWTLNDKNAGVRKASVLALQNLYEVDDNVPSLGLFTERFSNRMIELADDIDISVAVCGIGLVKQLLRHHLLNDDDLGSLYDLLIDEPPEIRRAIGSLVYEHLIARKSNSSQSHSRGDDDDSSVVHLGRMLQILREFSADQILSTYVIDDVWEYMDAMKDWKCILSMLLDENPMIELTDEDATNLIRLLSASVKKAVGERIVPATDNRKQYYSKAQREMMENNRRDVTISMMKRYPQLLRKFMADKGKIAPLVDIITHMNLELYSLKRQEQHFKTVLQLVKEAFCKHGEKDILRGCVKAINFCNTESRGELQDFAQNKLKELEDELIAKLKSAMREVANGDDEYSLLVTLKRLYELQLSRSVPIESLYEEMGGFLHRLSNLDDEVVNFLLLNMYLHVAWCLHSIINSGTVSEASLSSLTAKRNSLFEHLEKYYLVTLPEDQGEGKGGNQLACREYLGPEIISHFVMHGTSVAEIVKHLIAVLKKKDDDVSNLFLEALKRAYHRHKVVALESNDDTLAGKSFQECKDLAARLSGTFVGAARNKHVSDILKIVKDGIAYAFIDAPKQVSFLDGAVVHFVSKLPTPDILEILKDVQKRTENVNTEVDPSGWRPYYTFVDGLNDKYAKNEGFQVAEEKEGMTVRRRGRPRKSRNIQGKKLFNEQSSSEEEDSISVSDKDAQDEEQQEEDDEEAPLIHSIRSSSKLRSLRVSREKNKGQKRAGDFGQATENAAASRTSGPSS
ncbi:hypothetical protein RHMOL_Rhmol13G0023100 [Rhododendron molle]|uniref:Uncharacterized protein n=1 Tax=Rhododendron molle TaxID=49168 RepID=A0ACC0L253_RHOML|nr:hypothetical protein RHMOL_Rhmol13G0023100 [Rhododendron molle]